MTSTIQKDLIKEVEYNAFANTLTLRMSNDILGKKNFVTFTYKYKYDFVSSSYHWTSQYNVESKNMSRLQRDAVIDILTRSSTIEDEISKINDPKELGSWFIELKKS